MHSTSESVQVTSGMSVVKAIQASAATGANPQTLTPPIVITTTDVQRNRVDPAIWASISRVGRYSDSTERSSLRVDIECIVDNPADQ